ncbi:DUF1697 domain-containing protein [Psychroserpens ponticola]|uniref:DUF1697 domain-containing protein n=1 Tax=Psychroserpens ponticola TaxID=2932268 RepID=A0ABY7RVT4_9FLAO|nr:DUF1697 domain-containing protein [Psychroserpens ponticola]WCO01241.1 DUF1697 domain-containing protein [Psychroserpens ponticola]
MNTYIVLLRGINVGGHKKVPMAELRELLAKSGFENVRTYIQSGNIIFKSSFSDIKEIEIRVQKSIIDHFGFEVPVIAKTRKELQVIFDVCPFSDEKKENSYFVLLHDIPKPELVSMVNDISFKNEEFVIIKNCLYFHSSIGYGNSKFNMNSFEKKLNVKATSRNYKTMLKLLSLSSEN